MENKNLFTKLIENYEGENGQRKPLNEHYIDYIDNISLNENLSKKGKDLLIKLLKDPDLKSREEQWQALMSEIPEDQKEDFLSEIANPYFIGYGNPNSDILIIGKELGLNPINETDKFFNESVQNIFLWQQMLSGNTEDIENFHNPEKPFGGKPPKDKPGHTWNWYSKIIEKLTSRDRKFFLDYCFITEWNHKPSPKSKGKMAVIDALGRRKELFKHPFFQKFKYVINSSRAYDEAGERNMENIFDVEYKYKFDPDGNSKLRTFCYEDKDSGRKIVMTSQLSGRPGWSENAINQLAIVLTIDESDTEEAFQNNESIEKLEQNIIDKKKEIEETLNEKSQNVKAYKYGEAATNRDKEGQLEKELEDANRMWIAKHKLTAKSLTMNSET